MKKILLTIGFTLLFLPALVSAADSCPSSIDTQTDIKAYLSESLGAGCQVFHVTKCEKIQAEGILTCTEQNWNADEGKFKLQCERSNPQEGEPAYYPGRYIQRCEKPDLSEWSYEYTDAKKCKNEFGGVLKPYKATLFAAWTCPGGHVGACEGSKEGQVLAKVPAFDLEKAKAAFANFPELKDKAFGDDYDVAVVYTTGVAGDRAACSEGDFNADTKAYIGGDLSGDDQSFDSLTGGECTTANESPISNEPSITCTPVQLIIGKSGTGLLTQFIGTIYQWGAGIVGIVAVLVMVISGIQISVAGGDSAKVDSAKTRIMESIAGLVILFLSGLILYTINPNFFVV